MGLGGEFKIRALKDELGCDEHMRQFELIMDDLSCILDEVS